jgi:hypothetical protein
VAKVKNPRQRENKKGQGKKFSYPQELIRGQAFSLVA